VLFRGENQLAQPARNGHIPGSEVIGRQDKDNTVIYVAAEIRIEDHVAPAMLDDPRPMRRLADRPAVIAMTAAQ
jgi:hypothetical protein